MEQNIGEEDKKLNLQKAIEIINKLTKENKSNKKRIDYLEEKLELLTKDFENYKNIMSSNFLYNSIDINSYKLDDIFNLIDSDIIKTKEEFGLINKGIKDLFNKNIIYFQNKYKLKDDIIEEKPPQISSLIEKLEYLVFLVLTKNKKKFGVFINNINNKNNNDKNTNNINMENIMMNNNELMNDDNYEEINIKNNMLMDNNDNEAAFDLNDLNVVPMMNKGQELYVMNDVKEYNMMNYKQRKRNNMMNDVKGYNIINIAKKNVMNNLSKNNMMNMPKINMINKNMNNMNNIKVFNSNINENNYFVFSLDNLKLYYSDIKNENIIPGFVIKYDKRKKILYGNEIQFRGSGSSQTNLYILSGKNEFNVKDCELFEIQIG